MPEEVVAHRSEDDGDLKNSLRPWMSFDDADPDRRSDHADDGAGGCDESDLFTAKTQTDVKEIHKGQDESPSAL